MTKRINDILILLFCLFGFGVGFSQEVDPIANQEAIIYFGNARFTVLTPQLIRLEWDETHQFQDQASFVAINRKLKVPPFLKSERGDTLVLSTSFLTLTYLNDRLPFSEKNLSIEYALNSEKKRWYPGLQDHNNLKGTTRTLDGANGGKHWDGTDIELEDGILSRSGFMLLDDSKSFLFDNTDWPWVEKRSQNKTLDWYFFGYGYNYKQALLDYTKIAGKIPMIPQYALGYWWSRYWVYSDAELKDLVSNFRTYDIPIDVLIIDMDWHETFGGLKDIHNPEMDETGNTLGWTGYTWNRSLFPNPEKFLDWTNKNHLKTALNLHPASGIAPMEDIYDAFAKAYKFDTIGHHYIPYQMADKKWASVYFDVLLHPMEKMGVDFWWLDWQQYPKSKVVEGLSNTWWINYTFYSDMSKNKGKRPMIFHRWGGLGNHRYPIGFSGDDRISWGSLKYQTYFTSTAANVGYGYWSHDIGGHASGELDYDSELYVRWLQFGVFSPILRTHSAKISSIERRFWKYPDDFETMKELIYLRYSLAPYIYTAMHKAYTDGLSLCRPMYYEYPEREEAYTFKYQYYFGDDLLVAPVSDPVSDKSRLVEHTLWLPKGDWYEWHSGSLIKGDRIIHRKFAVDEIPIYVKSGSIIPMYPKIDNLQKQIPYWVLNIIPGDKGETAVYEDDGTSNEYTKGDFATTRVTQQTDGTSKNITIEPTKGNYKGQYSQRQYEIKLLCNYPPQSVTVNGVEFTFKEKKEDNHWSYDGKTLTTSVWIPFTPTNEKITITLAYSESQMAKNNLLNGKMLMFKRLHKIIEDMKVEVARSSWWSSLPNELLNADQVPTRIEYNPSKIIPLLETFDKSVTNMKPLILNLHDARPEKTKNFVDYLEYD